MHVPLINNNKEIAMQLHLEREPRVQTYLFRHMIDDATKRII